MQPVHTHVGMLPAIGVRRRIEFTQPFVRIFVHPAVPSQEEAADELKNERDQYAPEGDVSSKKSIVQGSFPEFPRAKMASVRDATEYLPFHQLKSGYDIGFCMPFIKMVQSALSLRDSTAETIKAQPRLFNSGNK